MYGACTAPSRAQPLEVAVDEVAVDNERALHLYTALGFAPVITEDYYRLPL